MSIRLTGEDLDKLAKAYPLLDFSFEDDYMEEVEIMRDAQLKKVAIELQAIYNIADLGASDRKMGEFIQSLLEEIK